MSRTRVLCVLFVIVAAIAGASCKKRNECAAVITKQPGNFTIAKGESATLTIGATTTGSNAVAYKWYSIGPAGSVPLPDSGPSITVKPEKTTTYFAWIYTQCGEKRGQQITDSAVVTVK